MFRDAFWLSLLFGGAALLGLWYYRTSPSAEQLRARLPNRVSLASLTLLALVGLMVWWVWQTTSGFSRIRLFIGSLFNLLVFESLFLLGLRWFRSNLLVVILSAILTGGLIWIQRSIGGNIVYNVTFIAATLGATTLLIRLNYLRTKLLAVVALLWMLYDILAVAFLYPQIYRIAERPKTSFFYPAVAVGQVTLGSGDFMFLALMTLVLLRDRSWRWAVAHIGVQVVALFVTIILKPPDTLLPYLTVMVPIWLVMWWLSRPNTRQRLLTAS